MDKYLVELYVPALNRRFEVYIPCAARIAEITSLCIASVEKIAGEQYPLQDAVLCDSRNSTVFDINQSAAKLGIKNGSQLMLI